MTCTATDLPDLEPLVAFVVAGCTPPPRPRQALVLRLAQDWPDLPGLALTLVLASAAQGLAAMLRDGRREAAGLYRLAALVAIDVLVLERRRPPGGPVTAGELARYWARGDPVFRPP